MSSPKAYSVAFHAACCVIPPTELSQPIQSIRSKHDSAYERWMPHINLLFPFIAPEDFSKGEAILREKLASVKPFKISLNAMQSFTHSSKSVLWLQPEVVKPEAAAAATSTSSSSSEATTTTVSAPAVSSSSSPLTAKCRELVELQAAVQSAFEHLRAKNTKSESGEFIPHMTLGQFAKGQVDSKKEGFMKQWKNIEFEVKEVCFVSREGQTTPMTVKCRVPLGGK